MADSLEFGNVFVEDMGILNNGRIRLGPSAIQFKNEQTGKVISLTPSNLEYVAWQRLGNKPGISFKANDGVKLRCGGFKETDFEKVKTYAKEQWEKELETRELVLRGWNYGDCRVEGKSIEFTFEGKPVFDVPMSNVSNCVGNKSEATIEFHQSEDCPTSLIEMRLHMPANPDDEEYDPVEDFRRAVMMYAGIETESGQPVASLSQILCTTPRGRYDIKVYPNFLSLHGKTYDYKIPIKTIMRLFLVPHKDGRHVYFVISLNPPIRQGQTRYHYLVLEFLKEEEIELSLGLTEQQLAEQYAGKLNKEMSGPLYEVVSMIFRVLINMKITVPGNFIGHSGTPAVMCAHRQASGFLYPLEKGFLYIHKPPMYIRFEEISYVNFARSDVSTRSFDFEIELKSGQTLLFNSVEKDEYNKLYDYVQNKHLRIRNARKVEKNTVEDRFSGSDDEIDRYKETVKAEGKEREQTDSDSEDDDYDLDEDLKKRQQERAEDSSEGSGSEPEEEYDSAAEASGSGGESGADSDGERKAKKSKKEKKAKSTKDSAKEPKEKKGKDSKKAKKDPNAPKRPQSAYFLWLNDKRSSLKKSGDSVADVAKRAGEVWKTVSASEKKPYEEKANLDKERYEKEKAAYKKLPKEASESAPSPPTAKASKKATGPSPSKAKSKEYISDSEGTDEEKGGKDSGSGSSDNSDDSD